MTERRDRRRLGLYEEVMLLVLRDREGTVEFGANYRFALGGAILAELLLEGRLGVEEVGWRRMAEIRDRSPLGDPILDECLERVAGAKRRGSLQTWVSRFASVKGLKERVAEGLCRKGILRAEEGRVLVLFRRKTYPEVDPGPEREIVGRLEEAIFTESEDLDSRTAVLVSLARGADLLPFVFPKAGLKRRRKRIDRIVNGEIAGRATREAIQAMQTAVIVATTVVHS